MIARLPRKAGAVLRRLLDSEASGGLVLMAAAGAALIVANSVAGPAYFRTLETDVAGMSVLRWVDDALMAVFFLLVGLEIKREMLGGELSTWSRRALPGVAALGGMVAPALVFVAFTWKDPLLVRGWAIPAATDIAFALGILALLGNRVPASLKIFLAALAIMDDLGAVLVIALFYTTHLSLPMLGGALVCVGALALLNWRRVQPLWPYLLIGLPLWWFVHASGVHATIAGVILAAFVPLSDGPDVLETENSPLHRLEHMLAPPVGLAIVPLFGFANAGVSFKDLTLESFAHPVTLGVAAGLFVGKQIGVFLATRIAVALGIARRPKGASWLQVYAVSLICGVGFTMSLFIGMLAYPPEHALIEELKIGVLAGSLVSALAGALILAFARSPAMAMSRKF